MSTGSAHSQGLVTTKSIVVSSLKYSEADLIVKCFTESHGLKSYLLRNILKSKKARPARIASSQKESSGRSGGGKLRASMFQALTQLEIVASHREKKNLHHIREAKIVYPYQNLHTDFHKTSIVFFLSEILRNSIQEEETDKALFHFLERSFIWLDEAENSSNFPILFLLKLTKYLGFYPDNSHSDMDYFNLLEGIFQDETEKYCLGKEDSLLLKSLLKMDYNAASTLKLNRKQRTHFLEVWLLYYELHLSGFRKPKSLEVLRQLFD
ncbi:MAG TPA: DNA repair protein RecO [Flavobacteriaceae bacterium]|nr:DNA repair protein RecO [Flavobacteriaceae bacterium]